MTEKNIKRIHLIYGLLLSCLILVSGACLIFACLSIYRSGEAKPFSRESVALAFERIAIPVYLCFGGIVGGILLALVLPLAQSKSRAILDPRDTLARQLSRLDEETLDADQQKRILDERKTRRSLKIVCAVICVACAAVVAIYTCNPNRYTLENLNGDILKASLVTLGGFALAFAVCFVCETLCLASVTRELDAVKAAVKAAPKKAEIASAKKKDPRRLWVIRGVILLAGLLLVLLGILNGGAEDVLGKAVRICTECIGLG